MNRQDYETNAYGWDNNSLMFEALIGVGGNMKLLRLLHVILSFAEIMLEG